MKTSVAVLFCVLSCLSVQASVQYTINEAWRFYRGDVPKASSNNLDDSKWELVNIPHTWNRSDAMDDVPGYYRGVGWYRKTIQVDANAKDKIVNLYFDGANQVTEVYVNEQYVGKHKGGYTRFSFDISQYIKPGQPNAIAVKVDNSHAADIPPLSADFTFFGGIYRNLYLQIKEQTTLSASDEASDGVYIKTPVVTSDQATVQITTLLDNHIGQNRSVQILQALIAPDGREIKLDAKQFVLAPNSVKTALNQEINLQHPMLWSPENPQLYLLKTILLDTETKKELDSQLNSFGLRWFHFDPDKGFSLNGRHLKLIGTNRHQCYMGKGNALPDEIHIEDIRLLKEMGGNMLRVSHYPQDPLILEMCDKLGIIASVEIPIVNEITESEAFLQNSLHMAREMVKQNFNHPSVVIWAYMNEVMLHPPFMENSERHVQYCKEVARQAVAINNLLRQLDSARYTMIPFHGALQRYEEAGLLQVPMIVGWNLYQGWYGGKFADFDKFLAGYHTKYPAIPVLITEYGADVDDRLHSLQPERFDFTVEYGDLYHEHYLQTILQNNYIAGATIWNLNDFYSEARVDAIPHVNTKGITTRDRRLKNTYLLYQANLLKEPMAVIGSKSWKYRTDVDNGDGTCLQPVKIYSNQPSVDLYFNGHFFKKLAMADHYYDLEMPFKNGKNSIELRIRDKTYDFAEFYCNILPVNFQKNGIIELNVMLGSRRYFEDREARIVWIPEQPYVPGGWGYIGGNPVRPKTKSGTVPSTPLNIAGTTNDPVFQTQREGLQAFKADVPMGAYAVYLYWANLSGNDPEKSIYNLGNNAIGQDRISPVMDVTINEQRILSQFDIAASTSTANTIIKKIIINVLDDKGLTVRLDAIKGSTILNAIRLVKLN